MLKLFTALSAWQPTGCPTLELNAFSPSDSKHWFKNHHFEPVDGDLELTQHQQAATWHDPKHGWGNGTQVKAPLVSAILRLFSPLCWSLPTKLPSVCAVTELVIRRQLRRRIALTALIRLLERLPRLESLVYETWRIWQQVLNSDRDKGTIVSSQPRKSTAYDWIAS